MKLIPLLILIFTATSCMNKTESVKPKLVVLLSIDQMRGDYWDSLLKPLNADGGFQTLFEEGTIFQNAHHKHAVTTTAAGHATLATGFYPSNNGIVNNTVYNRQEGYSHYCIWDTTVTYVGIDSCDLNEVSAEKLLKPTLGDYVKKANPLAKSYSVALKDRASILMGGQLANRAFWFDARSTQMVSTDYYEEDFPEWVKLNTAEKYINQHQLNVWDFDKTHLPAFTHKEDSFYKECGTFTPWFPHSITSMDSSRVRGNEMGTFTWNSPYGDAFVLDFAINIITEQQLGTDEHTDVLTVGLSAADVIGHQFGPNSLEILDYYHKLDKYIAEFISFLDSNVGEDEYLLVLTSDHGVVPFPEISELRDLDAQRITNDQFDSDILRIDNNLKAIFNLKQSTILKSNYNGVEPHFSYLDSEGVDSTQFIDSLQVQLLLLPYIDNVYSFFDYSDKSCDKPYIDLMRNSHNPNYEYFVKILGKKNYLVDMRTCGTTHGSPYEYDTHVPLVFYGSEISQEAIQKRVQTVDIVPSILEYIRVESDTKFDGTSLKIR